MSVQHIDFWKLGRYARNLNTLEINCEMSGDAKPVQAILRFCLMAQLPAVVLLQC